MERGVVRFVLFCVRYNSVERIEEKRGGRYMIGESCEFIICFDST